MRLVTAAAMDDDEDYFTPTATASRRLAMLFGPEEMSSDGSGSSHRSPNTQFKFVAPRQQRVHNNSASSSPSSGPSQPASADGQEVLLKVPLILLSQGTEKNGMPRTQVICQVVGSTAQRSFSLVVARVGQTKGEVWRAVVDSHLTLEVVEHSTVKMTSPTSEMLTLLGEAQQIEAMVTQVAICQGVASSRVTQQDLHTGKGHVLTEGDVAKVSCTTYAITAGTCRGEKVHEVKGVKITVSDPTIGSWESCLTGATADSHRLIFIPKHEKGSWQPPTQYYDVKVAKVKTKGGREKAVAAVRSSSQPEQEQQQQGLTSNDASPARQPLTITDVRVESGDSPGHSAGEEEDKTSRKAALVTRMAQVGTQIFPLLPGARPVPQAQVKPPVAERSRTESPEVVMVSTSTPATNAPTLASANLTPATTTTASTSTSFSTPATVSSSGSVPAHTTTPGTIPGPAPATHLQASSESHGIPLAHSVTQLSTTVAKIADRVEMLLAKVERVEVKSKAEAEGGCVPETLMALASGLVEHNKTLKTQLEEAERRLGESQAAQTSLLTMNAQLLEEKREMLRKEDELRKKVDEKEEELKEERNQQSETEPGLMPKEVQSLVKATLNGLFRTMASDFSEETYYSQSQVFQTLRSGFETAYSSFVEDLEKMTEGETEQEQKEKEQEEEKGQEEEQEHQQQGRENEEREHEVGRGEREEMR